MEISIASLVLMFAEKGKLLDKSHCSRHRVLELLGTSIKKVHSQSAEARRNLILSQKRPYPKSFNSSVKPSTSPGFQRSVCQLCHEMPATLSGLVTCKTYARPMSVGAPLNSASPYMQPPDTGCMTAGL